LRARVSPFRVLLVDEVRWLHSAVHPLFESGELVACDEGSSFEEALSQVRRHKPDVVVVELTGPDAFGAIEALMAEAPTPILALHPERRKDVDPIPALALGALDVAVLPVNPAPNYFRELTRKLSLLAQVRVVKHVQGAKRKRGTKSFQSVPEPPFPLVAIAASLGGPRALSSILRMIPKGFPAPLVICQHISDGFTEGLAHWLAHETSLKVHEARDGDWMIPGTAFIAPSGAHLLVEDDGRLKLDSGPPLMGFKPSCDALLYSAAQAFGRRAIGVVLTGMGRDGARGLKEIRDRGGRTLVQDEATSVVFGMPGAAVELGAAEEIVALDGIAATLIKLVDQC
jgi:two-component system, chemotaxis family, protein-glutamate methylesterase/glutaminase